MTSFSLGPGILPFIVLALLVGFGFSLRDRSYGVLMLWLGVLGMLGLILAQIVQALGG